MTGGRSPRDQGNRAERLVAKYLDGERVVGSGAYKFSNKNLLGDVDVYLDGRPYLKLEVKTTGRTHVKRGLYYTVPYLVLHQMETEAHQYHQLGCLWIHFKGSSPSSDYAIFPIADLYAFAEGVTVELIGSPIQNGKSTPLFKRDLEQILYPGGLDSITCVELHVTADQVTNYYGIVLGQDVKYVLDRKRGEK